MRMALGAARRTGRGWGSGGGLLFACNSGDRFKNLRRGWEGLVVGRSGNGRGLRREDGERRLD